MALPRLVPSTLLNWLQGGRRAGGICNSTTENQQSLFRTALANGIDDFGVFAPPTSNSTIGDTKGEEVI
ncbi:hypothetical protein H4582DRAFT_2082166 [Lactarius indigo]|nr:hypothetical protein H4582DRAFT_2082166 [Lactarius indigo]